MKRLSLAALAALISGPALAGGPTTPATAPVVMAPAPVAPVYDWSGFYAGGQIGYGDVSGDLDGYGNLGGLHAGYMWDFGSYVLGAEVDYDVADLQIGGGPDAVDAVARLKLRGGLDLGRTLVYATAGAAQASATVGGTGYSDTGWFGGLGIGYQLTDQWIVGGEVLGHRFDDFDGTGLDVEATTATVRASFRF